jgi:hypothetical protein
MGRQTSGQNVSSAVMQRRTEANDSLDDFPTPPWATRALCEWLMQNGHHDIDHLTCREPAANRGHMVTPLREFFGKVEASDVHDYGYGFPVEDYLFGPASFIAETDWTITNPPFRLAEQFIQRALERSRVGVAVIVRAAFLEGIGRYQRLYAECPPTDILQFTERVVMHKGRLAPEGSSATAYAWLVWEKAWPVEEGTRFHWIPPCRRRLEKPGDYPPEGEQ